MVSLNQKKNSPEEGLLVRNLNKSFSKTIVLNNINFEVHRSEAVGLLGPNGAGKTSMLNVINGFYHPHQGQIHFKGLHRQQMHPHEAAVQGIARTFQNVALFKGMSTLNNIMAGRNLKMKRSLLWQALHYGPAWNEEMEHRL